MDDQHKILIAELTKLLLEGTAHISLPDALRDMKPELRGVKPQGMPYSIWQLVEHIRIAQWDMFQFCRDANHESPKWPDDYWPKESTSEDDFAWEGSLQQISSDLDEFIELMEHSDIYQKIPHGFGFPFPEGFLTSE